MQHDLKKLKELSEFINEKELPLFYDKEIGPQTVYTDDDLYFVLNFIPEHLLKTEEGQELLKDAMGRSQAYLNYLDRLPKPVKAYRRAKSFLRGLWFGFKRWFSKKRKFPSIKGSDIYGRDIGRDIPLEPNFNSPIYKKIMSVPKQQLIEHEQKQVALYEQLLKDAKQRLADFEAVKEDKIVLGSYWEKGFKGKARFTSEGEIPEPTTDEGK